MPRGTWIVGDLESSFQTGSRLIFFSERERERCKKEGEREEKNNSAGASFPSKHLFKQKHIFADSIIPIKISQ